MATKETRRQFLKKRARERRDVKEDIQRQKFAELQGAPEDEEFEFEEPAVAQVGPTAAEAAEEEAELESGQYKIPGMAPAVASRVMRAQAPRLTEEADAQFLKDLEDLPEAKAEVSREQTFRGAGNYTYAKTADGDWFFTSPSGKTGVAKKGSKAWQSITSESEGKGSLYGTEGFAGFEAKKPDKDSDAEGTSYADYEADPDAYYGKAEREAKAEIEADEKPAEIKPPTEIRGNFSLDNPPPAHSPAKISRFLDENPGASAEKLTAFITHANYPDRQAAAQMFVDTMNAKAEMASLAKRAGSLTESGNLTVSEMNRYANLRQALGVPATLSDRVLAASMSAGIGAAAGAPFAGIGAGPGALAGTAYGILRPRDILKLNVGTPTSIVSKSPGAPVSSSGEDIGALLEEQFKSE